MRHAPELRQVVVLAEGKEGGPSDLGAVDERTAPWGWEGVTGRCRQWAFGVGGRWCCGFRALV